MKLKKKASPEAIRNKTYKKPKQENDWDFDFSIYQKEEQKAEELQSVKRLNKPRITGLRSKFSPSMMELESLEGIKNKISIFGIRVASRSQEIQDLWKLYGCLDEYWARIHDIYGSIIIKEIQDLKKECYKELIQAESQSTINYRVHRMLLKLRDRIYIASQRANLGLEVEKTSFSHYDKAKKGIIE